MKTHKLLFLSMLALLCLTTSCEKDDSATSADDKLKESLIGGWYNEEHSEYDEFFKSGTFYYELAGNFTGDGTYDVKDGVLTLSTTMYGEAITTSNYLTISGSKMVWEDVESGDVYEYIKVIDDVHMNIGESISLSSITQGLEVEKISISNSPIIVDENADKITAYIDGSGFMKISTNDGDVAVRFTVENENNVLYPDMSNFIGKSQDELTSIIGIPYYLKEEYSYYKYNSSLISSAMFSINSDGYTYSINITFNSEVDTDKILAYLNENYEILIDGSESGTYIYTTDKAQYIAFIPSLGSMQFMSL